MERGLPPYPLQYDVRFNVPLHNMQSMFYGRKLLDLYKSGDIHIFGNMSIACRLDVFLSVLMFFLFRGNRPGKTMPALQIIRETRTKSQISESVESTVNSHVPRAKRFTWDQACGHPHTVQEVTKDGVTVHLSTLASARMRVHTSTEPCMAATECPYCKGYHRAGRHSHRIRCCKNTTTVVHVCKKNPNQTCGAERSAVNYSMNTTSSALQNKDTMNNFVMFRGKEDGIEMQEIQSLEIKIDQSSRAVSSATHSRVPNSKDGRIRSKSITEDARTGDATLRREPEITMGDCSRPSEIHQKAAVCPIEDTEKSAPDVGDTEAETRRQAIDVPLIGAGPLLTKSSKGPVDKELSGANPKIMYSIMSCDSDDFMSSKLMEELAYVQGRLISSDSDSDYDDFPSPTSSRSISFSGYPLQMPPSRCQSECLIVGSRSNLSLISLRSLI